MEAEEMSLARPDLAWNQASSIRNMFVRDIPRELGG